MQLVTTDKLKHYNVHSKGNGCGNSVISLSIGKFAQWVARVCFKPACDTHDNEWSIPLREKSVAHWKESNGNLQYNCMLLCGEPSVSKVYLFRLRVAVLFYAAVMLNTYDDYLRG